MSSGSAEGRESGRERPDDGAAVLRHAEPVMGTVVSFQLRPAPDAACGGSGAGRAAALEALRRAVRLLHRADEVFSTFRPDSDVSRLGRGTLALADCAPEVAEVLELCGRAERDSGGWFSARAAGRLDPSGAVKGWAVERAARALLDAGCADVCVNGGGDVQAYGEAEPGRGWSIAVAHPLRPGAFATVVRREAGGAGGAGEAAEASPGRAPLAVATSGTAERGAHIFDPHTGRSVHALASLTVVGASLTEVDIAATAAFAMSAAPDGGPAAAREWLEGRPGLEAFAVTPSGRAWWTSGYPSVGLVPAAG